MSLYRRLVSPLLFRFDAERMHEATLRSLELAQRSGLGRLMLARMAQFAALFGGGRSDDHRGSNPIGLLAAVIVAPLAAMGPPSTFRLPREGDRELGYW